MPRPHLSVLGKRLARYGLTLHPDKTRFVDFRNNRPNGTDHPETDGTSFTFLGFAHVWGKSKASIAYSAVAALFVRKAELDLPHPLEALAGHYQLTPTELKVLIGVVQIGGVPEIADAFGVSQTTVKTHLSRLFGKTGTSRQADLVKIVAGFASPLMASQPE